MEFIFLKMPTDGIMYEPFEMYTPTGDAISGKNLLVTKDPFSVASWILASNEELSRKKPAETLLSSGERP